MINDSLIISVKEARVILGESAMAITDQQIEELVSSLHSIAKLTFQAIIEGRMNMPDHGEKI